MTQNSKNVGSNEQKGCIVLHSIFKTFLYSIITQKFFMLLFL